LEISAGMVRELRDKTNAGMMDCKQALQQTGGDMNKAIDLLRQKGLATAMKRAGKEASEGVIHAYIHGGGRMGVLVEVNCETDFAAKSQDFQDVVERERAIYLAQAQESGKPANILDKMVDGKLRKFYQEVVLLEQTYVKDPDKTIQDYLNELLAKTGEKIIIKRFVRFQLGGE
jgi:elongation factor Ts